MRNILRAFKTIPVIILIIITISGCANMPFKDTKNYLSDLYRRIPYTKDGNYRVIKLFYSTTRQAKDEGASYVFGNKLNDTLSNGELTIKIDPSLKIDKMLPNVLKRRGVINLEDVTKIEYEEFMKKLKSAVEASPHNSLMILVFGYKDGFDATAIKAAYFSYLLDVNTPILLFDWPGDQGISVGGYLRAQDYAARSGAYLGRLITDITKTVKPGKLWINASSLGCQTVCSAFEEMHKDPEMADAELEIDHVVLAAPDVGQDEFNNKFKEELTALSKKLTTYISSNDTALLISTIINHEKRLGRQNLKKHTELDEAKAILYLKSMTPEKITLIDITPINKSSFHHGYYLESPDFYDDFYMRIFDKGPNISRRLFLMKHQDSVDYWVMRSNNR